MKESSRPEVSQADPFAAASPTAAASAADPFTVSSATGNNTAAARASINFAELLDASSLPPPPADYDEHTENSHDNSALSTLQLPPPPDHPPAESGRHHNDDDGAMPPPPSSAWSTAKPSDAASAGFDVNGQVIRIADLKPLPEPRVEVSGTALFWEGKLKHTR